MALDCRFWAAANSVKEKLADDRGSALIEYALLISLIAVVCVVSIKLIGQDASTLLSKAANSL